MGKPVLLERERRLGADACFTRDAVVRARAALTLVMARTDVCGCMLLGQEAVCVIGIAVLPCVLDMDPRFDG
jgi:hypothetical protein